MIILDAVSLDLDNKVDHLATTWQVSDDLSFQNIVIESEENYKDKTQIVFSNNLDPNIKYFARARALLSTGWTEWGNVEVFKVKNNTDLQPQDVFPTRVSIPKISTYRMVSETGTGFIDTIHSMVPDNNNIAPENTQPSEGQRSGSGDEQEFNTNYEVNELLHYINPMEHDLTLFEIWAKGFQVIGNAKHLATSWWIENSQGNIIWAKYIDRVNLTRIMIKDIILKANELYRIKVVFHTNSNDVSQIGTYTIISGGCDNVNLISYLDQVSSNRDLNLKLEYREGIYSVIWEILSLDLGQISSHYLTHTTTIQTVIPKGTLKHNHNYLLRIKTNLQGCYKYYPFITTAVTDESPNDPPTPILVYPLDIKIGKGQLHELYVESIASDIKFINNDVGCFKYDQNTNLITGIDSGTGTLFIRAKMKGYSETIVKINVTVQDQPVNAGDIEDNISYVRVKPEYFNLNINEKKLANITTNCKSLTAEFDNNNISYKLENNVLTLKGIKDGKFNGIVIGYDIEKQIVASCPIAGTVIDTGIKKNTEEIPQDVTTYTIEANPSNINLVSGNTTIVRISTNAPYWDVRSTDGSFFTARKLNINQLEVTCNSPGTGNIVLMASTADKDVANITIGVSSTLNREETEFILDQNSYDMDINSRIPVTFTSNINSPDEYSVTVSGEGVSLLEKNIDHFTLQSNYNAAGNNYNVTVRAQKDSSQSTYYNENIQNIRVNVRNLIYSQDEVFKFTPEDIVDRNERSVTCRYKGGLHNGEGTYFPPNPITYTFYVHPEVLAGKCKVQSIDFREEVGNIISQELGNLITDEDHPFNGYKPFTFKINTNTNSSPYGLSTIDNHFNLMATVEIRGVKYYQMINLHPVPELRIRIELNGDNLNNADNVNIDPFFYYSFTVYLTKGYEIQCVASNKESIRFSDQELTYEEHDLNLNRVEIPFKSYYSGSSNVAFMVKDIGRTIGDPLLYSSYVNLIVGTRSYPSIPVQGDKNFGLYVAPTSMLEEYELRPYSPSTVDDPESNEFGNYVDEQGNVMVYIPKLYFKYEDGGEYNPLLNLREGQKPYILKASPFKEEGYFLDRCFINNGKEIKGIFVDKYSIGFRNTNYIARDSIPHSHLGTKIADPEDYIGKQILNLNEDEVPVTNLNVLDKDKIWSVNLAKNRNRYTSWNDIFVSLLLYRIVIASYHGYLLKGGTPQDHPFYTQFANQPQPIMTTANHSLFSRNLEYELTQAQATGDFQEGFHAGGRPGLAPSQQNYNELRFITHNGSPAGVCDLFGLNVYNQGILVPSLNGQSETRIVFWVYKLSTDRSNITARNILDENLYDKIYLDLPNLNTQNRMEFKLIGNRQFPMDQAEFEIGSKNYLISSIGLSIYGNHYQMNPNPSTGEIRANDSFFVPEDAIESTPMNLSGVIDLTPEENEVNESYYTVRTSGSLYEGNELQDNFVSLGHIKINSKSNLRMNGGDLKERQLRRCVIIPNEGDTILTTPITGNIIFPSETND